MWSRIACASVLLGGAIASGCSDSPVGAIADTTKTNNNTATVCGSPLTSNDARSDGTRSGDALADVVPAAEKLTVVGETADVLP